MPRQVRLQCRFSRTSGSGDEYVNFSLFSFPPLTLFIHFFSYIKKSPFLYFSFTFLLTFFWYMCVSFYQCFFSFFFCGGRRESPCAQPRKPRMSNVYLDFTRAPISTGRRSSIRYNWGDDPRISFPKSVVDVQMLILRCGDLFTYHFLGLIFIYLFKSISIIHPFFSFLFWEKKMTERDHCSQSTFTVVCMLIYRCRNIICLSLILIYCCYYQVLAEKKI